MGREHHHGSAGPALLQTRQTVNAAAARQANVQQHQIDSIRQRQRILQGARLKNMRLQQRTAPQHQTHAFPKEGVVLDQ